MTSASTYKSICSYCGVGCGIIVSKDTKGNLSVKGDPDYPVNKGMLCSKGMNLHYVVQDTSDRIMYPTMRWNRNAPLKKVSWDTAIDRAASVFRSIIEKHGPDSVAFYVSGQCLTEEYYLINKIAKGFIGTNNIDTNSRLCMSSAVVGYKKAIGDDCVPISYDDIELSDCVLISGANPAWCHPILFRRLEEHKKNNPKTKIIVVDPKKTQSCAIADLHLQIIPGTDIVLFNAIARRLIQNNTIDKYFIKHHAEGFRKLKELVYQTSLAKAASICGIEVSDIKTAAKYIGNAEAFLSMWTMGLNQSVVGVDKNSALINLSLITGQIGRPGCGPFSLTGQPNAMGGREVGGMANLLAAHKNLLDEKDRNEVEKFWGGTKISDKPGLTATEIIEGIEKGKIKALWVVCTNPVVSLPDSNRVEKALKKVNFLIVQDISHHSESTKFADLLLPAAGWLEKEGTMTNSERRISYLPKVIDPPGEALADSEIFIRFAKKMNFNGFNYDNISEVYDEHCALTKGTIIDVSGLSHQRLIDEGSFQWPVPNTKHPGTIRLFEDKQFATDSKKAQIICPENSLNKSEPLSTNFPLILTTGRIRDQWHTRTKTGKVSRLNTHIPSPYLEMNPINAIERNIKEGDIVEITNKRGTTRVKVQLNYDIKRGVVFMPMHWGTVEGKDFGRANNLTQQLVDPVSKEPDYKFSAVQVSKYKKEKQHICIIGAGAAAYRFIKTYREHNQTDTISVFSQESEPFYNRVLLPEYVSEDLTFEELKKMKKGEVEKLKLDLYTELTIKKINRENNYLIDSNNEKHNYDLLIMAMGSRAFLPSDVPIHLPGAFTMRNKIDADNLKSHLKKSGLKPQDQHVLIVGGGLLGLELAASLKKRNIKVTIVQRASRLMERQLDRLASKLLAEHVQDIGIQIYFNNEVSTVFEDLTQKNAVFVTLKTGKTISVNAIVYAIGTIPNIELAKASQLDYGRGVKVNQYLQTKDENIFALGEIAEHNNLIYGITASAEQQADIAAKFILGDLNSIYTGSILMNILKFEDLDLCSIGNVLVNDDDDSYEEILLMDVTKHYYKKCIVQNDLLVGAILMGDKNEFAEFKRLIENKIELSEKRTELLRGNQKSEPIVGRLICSCSQVGEGNLKKAIKEGHKEFNQLCSQTGAGLGCGSCKPEVNEILIAAM